VYNTKFTVAATASSGLPVAFSSSVPCSNNGPTYTMTSSSGTCTVRFSQAGNANYNLAPRKTEIVNALPWTLVGFYQPVDMGGVYNVVTNGKTVPLIFEIFAGAVERTNLASVKSLAQVEIACSPAAPTDNIETLATGKTSLRYDTATGKYIYNWKTPTAAGKCYRVTITTQDGSSLVAFFKLK
jgi:hypothetical protein